VSREGNGEVRNWGTCCLETLRPSAPETENNSPVSAARRKVGEEDALRH